MIHITTEGEPVPGNPFIGTEGALPEIYSSGHRNPQGLDIHPVTGELWLSEMGPRGGDEVNLIKPGKNYRWPTITYGIEYSGKIMEKSTCFSALHIRLNTDIKLFLFHFQESCLYCLFQRRTGEFVPGIDHFLRGDTAAVKDHVCRLPHEELQ